MKHYLICESPLCADERAYKGIPNWESGVPWYPGEPMCRRKPYTKWQKRQARINRLYDKGLFKYGNNFYFTVKSLMNRCKIMKGTKGANPDAKTWEKPLPAKRRLKR